MLYIGVICGGPELQDSHSSDRLGEVMRKVEELRGDFVLGSKPALNLVFYVPGSLSAPDFTNLRVCRYDARRKLLLIQAAVPDEYIEEDSFEPILREAMREAISTASIFFTRKKEKFDEAEALEIVVNI